MKTRSEKVQDIDGYGEVRFYTAPHEDVADWGDTWPHRMRLVEYYHGFENVVDTPYSQVLVQFSQEGQDPFVVVLDKEALKAALKEVGL